jgi:hypothetical protein
MKGEVGRSVKNLGVVVAVTAAVLVQSAPALGAPPTQPPPNAGSSGPPAAWLDDGRRTVWLAYAAYCWDSNCVRMRSPAARSDIPRIGGLRNRTLRLHFAFAARQVTVSALTTRVIQRLKPGRLVLWPVRQTGVVLINVNVPGRGTVSYAVNLRP